MLVHSLAGAMHWPGGPETLSALPLHRREWNRP